MALDFLDELHARFRIEPFAQIGDRVEVQDDRVGVRRDGRADDVYALVSRKRLRDRYDLLQPGVQSPDTTTFLRLLAASASRTF
jgi:hypothetical protein